MGTVVWCDRAPYHIKEGQHEATQIIEDLRAGEKLYEFVWFNVDGQDWRDAGGEQVALRIDKISAVCKT